MKTTLPLLSLAGLALAGLALTSAKAPAAAPPAAAATTWEIDPVHSAVLFRCKHLNTSWAYGRFNDVQGTITLDAEKPEASKVAVQVKTDSVDTNSKQRDDHLRGPDFFDVKQFPTATFESTAVKKTGATTFHVTGKLSLHGVTKEVALDMEQVGSSEDKRMGKRAGFAGTLTIQRSQFGIKYMPDGLGEDVALTLSFEVVQK
jgi:polyisoprenoid-binding protein YceI